MPSKRGRILPVRVLTVVTLIALTLTGLPADLPHSGGNWPGLARVWAWIDGLVEPPEASGVYEIFTRPSVSGRTELIMHRFFRPDPR